MSSRLLATLWIATSICIAHAAQADDDRRRGRLADTVVTAWWVIFNDPMACMNQAPDGGTCLIIPVADPPMVDDLFAANGCVTHGTGATVDPRGNVRLVASIYATDPAGGSPPCILGDGGLLDPMGAEAHLVVRTHGRKLRDRELFLDQLTTFDGGCPPGPTPGPNRCADLQAAFHAPCDPADAACDPTRSDRDVIWLPEPFLLSAGLSQPEAERLAFEKAGTSTLYRSENGLTLVIETSLEALRKRGKGSRR